MAFCVFVILFSNNPFLTDHALEQGMEIEALEAILMDDFKGLNIFLFGKLLLRTQNPPFCFTWFQITNEVFRFLLLVQCQKFTQAKVG